MPKITHLLKNEASIQEQILSGITPVVGAEAAYQVMLEVRSRNLVSDRIDFYRAIRDDLLECVKNGTRNFWRSRSVGNKYKWNPVGPEEFLLDEFYLNKRGDVYPKVLPYYVELNSGNYSEAVLTGAIGVAKTSIALWTTAYNVYLLSCYKDPSAWFQIEKSSEFLFVFQSISGAHAKSLDYDRFKAMLQVSPYFTEKFPFDPSILSSLKFPNRIEVMPISGAETGAIGKNVFGGILDEVNFMQIVEKSKQSADKGTYNQALQLYNSITRRRKSRFMNRGSVPGVFCIVSSKRYPGQFTDKKTAEAEKELKETGKTSIYVYDKKTWEVLPEDRFSGVWFNMFIGDLNRKPRIMAKTEKWLTSDNALILRVPEEYRSAFEDDPIGSLRDIGGVSTIARHPFLMNQEAVSNCFGRVKSVLSCSQIDFHTSSLQVYPKRFRDKDQPRFAHIDLAITGDSAGLTVGHVREFVTIKRGADQIERLPLIDIDLTLRVMPPKGGEINFEKIRNVLYVLRDRGMPIKWVSLDSFQSTDSIQLLRSKGFFAGTVSVDTDTAPYDVTKAALYDRRLLLPKDDFLLSELVSLERDFSKKGKIDHPVSGSKDVADSLAGVVYGLTMRREIWAMHDVSPEDIPASISQHTQKMENRLRPVTDPDKVAA